MPPSVTQVLSPFTDFSRVRPDVLEAACERGTAVHQALAAHALGLYAPPLPAEYQGRFDSGRRWFDAMVDGVLSVEEEYISERHGYVGHPDLVCGLKQSSVAVIDYKTPLTTSKTWAVQLAGYRELLRENGIAVERCGVVMLDPDGGMARFVEYTSGQNDWAVFLSALNCWKYFH